MNLAMLPVPAALAIVIVVSAAVACCFTFGLRAILRPPVTDELKNLSSSSSTRHGAILALILALAFNSVMREYNELSESIDEEAVLIAQVLEDVTEEIGTPKGISVIKELAIYVRSIINEDWIARDPFSESLSADDALYQLRTQLEAFQPDYKETVADIDKLLDEMERRRLQRLFDHEEQLPVLFWTLAVLLFFMALLPFAHYAPTRTNALYIAGYGSAIGIVMYGILMFSSPFTSSVPIDNTPLRVALAGIERECAHMQGCVLSHSTILESATSPEAPPAE